MISTFLIIFLNPRSHHAWYVVQGSTARDHCRRLIGLLTSISPVHCRNPSHQYPRNYYGHHIWVLQLMPPLGIPLLLLKRLHQNRFSAVGGIGLYRCPYLLQVPRLPPPHSSTQPPISYILADQIERGGSIRLSASLLAHPPLPSVAAFLSLYLW